MTIKVKNLGILVYRKSPMFCHWYKSCALGNSILSNKSEVSVIDFGKDLISRNQADRLNTNCL